MFVARSFPIRLLWHFGWRNAVRMTVLSSAVYGGYELLGWKWLAIPFLPVSTVGAAVAFYIGFKNNSAYERLWEARRIWGGIVNTSRSFAMSVLSLVGHRGGDSGEAASAKRELIYRQLAWANALRLQLRRPSVLNASQADLPHVTAMKAGQASDYPASLREALTGLLSAEEGEVALQAASTTNRLLAWQAETLAGLKRKGALDEYEHSDLMRHIGESVQHQGAAERIKTFPFPRQYANFSLLFVNIFLVMLPFGLVRELSVVGSTWMVIPFSILLGWVFYTMEQVGDSSENPFENALNDVPMTAMCRNLEIDLKELLGETKLPERLQPVDDVLL